MSTDIVKPKRVGRPTKTALEAKKVGNRNKVGRPAGDAAIINEYKARMLASPKSQKVIDSIFNAALDDDHKNQAAAWKFLGDRLLPLSYFDLDRNTAGKSAITINITGLGDTTISEEIEDADYEEVQ